MVSTVSGNPSKDNAVLSSKQKVFYRFYIGEIYFISIFHFFSFENQLKLHPCSDCIYDVLPGKYSGLYNRDRTFHKNGNATSMVFFHLKVSAHRRNDLVFLAPQNLTFVTLHL